MYNGKCALYARVSTLEQNPENQLYSLQKYALERDYHIFNEYVDEISGCASSRPALNDLMHDLRQGEFKAVFIWKLDRLGRSLPHLIQIVTEMEKHGVDLITQTQGSIDTTTSTGKLIFQIFGAIAEFERELIRERVILGLERAKREGKRLGRPKGKKDTKRRRTSGYIQRWANDKNKRVKKSPRKKRGCV
jgi:DNA invertase Pin-like site-specific DNA recombinase